MNVSTTKRGRKPPASGCPCIFCATVYNFTMLIMGWENYFRLYAYLVQISRLHTFAFETRATECRNLVEFRMVESTEAVDALLENYVYTHLA
jgi:hypothetical protein